MNFHGNDMTGSETFHAIQQTNSSLSFYYKFIYFNLEFFQTYVLLTVVKQISLDHGHGVYAMVYTFVVRSR